MQNVEILAGQQLTLERGSALVEMLSTERTTKDEQKRRVLGHTERLATAGAIALDHRTTHRIARHEHMVGVALTLKDRAGRRYRNAHAGGMRVHHLIGQTRNRVLLVQQIRNAGVLAPTQQRDLNVSTKADSGIGLTDLREVTGKRALRLVDAPQ